jgi:glycosyltransferase involved in cell wall biosynthesis
MRLSVIIPAYNERFTLGRVLERVSRALPDVSKEIIIVDDGSSDGTRQWLQANFAAACQTVSGIEVESLDKVRLLPPGHGSDMSIRVVIHERNAGKGAALRSGLAIASGGLFVIQDGDLEYDPQDWVEMYELIAVQKVADVVFGCRFYGRPHRSLYFHHYLGNRLISILFNVLYNQTLTDIEACYKMFSREVRDTLDLTCDDFGVEVQIAAQIALAKRWRIYEMGIRYYGRTYAEGKKVNWKDGLKALWYLAKFRVRARSRGA